MRAATKQIHKSHITHNFKTLSSLAPDSIAIAVIKANAYGHEASAIIDALNVADLLAVATIEEAISLRQAGAEQSIILLEGVFQASELNLAEAQRFEPVIATEQQLTWLLDYPVLFPRIWCKLDTGMGRLGFMTSQANQVMQRLLSRYQERQIVLMTHFSSADLPNREITLAQIAAFDAVAKCYPLCSQSLCNSAGTLAFPDAHRDFIRLGIALYGVSPFAEHLASDHDLLPAMTLTTRISSVKTFQRGQPIGYGQTYHLPDEGRVAIAEIGYADGYSRFIPSGTPILINGKEYPLIGRVSMDMITILVDQSVRVGDTVTCWGQGLPIERICESANTIAHQLLTTVTDRPYKVVH